MAKPYLGNLDIPIAVLSPQEVIYSTQRLAELEILVQFGHLGDQVVQPAQYPAVLWGEDAWLDFHLYIIHLADHESGGVPELVGEIAAALQFLRVELHIVPRRVAGAKGEAQGISAILLSNSHGVDHVAAGLA